MPALPLIAPVAPDGDKVALAFREVDPARDEDRLADAAGRAGLDAPPQTSPGVATGEAGTPPDDEADALGTTALFLCGGVPQPTRIRPTSTAPKAGAISRIPCPPDRVTMTSER